MKITQKQLEKELSKIFQKYAGQAMTAIIRQQVINDITEMFKKHDVEGGKYIIDIQEIEGKIVVKINDLDKSGEKDILKEIILSRYSKN